MFVYVRVCVCVCVCLCLGSFVFEQHVLFSVDICLVTSDLRVPLHRVELEVNENIKSFSDVMPLMAFFFYFF